VAVIQVQAIVEVIQVQLRIFNRHFRFNRR
jgi:hypothetical protein